MYCFYQADVHGKLNIIINFITKKIVSKIVELFHHLKICPLLVHRNIDLSQLLSGKTMHLNGANTDRSFCGSTKRMCV